MELSAARQVWLAGRGRVWEAVEEGSLSGGVVMGTQGGGEVLRRVMAEVEER